MGIDNIQQPGLEPVQHPDLHSGFKTESSRYTPYGGPPYGSSPQNSYQSPQHSYGTPAAGYGKPNSSDPYVAQYTQPSKTGRRICGLAAATFLLLLAIVVLIIAAGVGSGVGASIAVKNAKTACLSDAAVTASSLSAALASATRASKTSSSSTASSSSASATATPSSTQPWGAVGTDIGLTECPNADQTIYTSKLGHAKYKIFCNDDLPGNDLMQTLVTTMGLCMEACSSWNLSPNINTKCAGIAYIPSQIDGDGGGNPIDCYLKSVANETELAPNTYVVDFAIIQ